MLRWQQQQAFCFALLQPVYSCLQCMHSFNCVDITRYTESIFALFSFLGMYYVVKGRLFYSSLWFACASATRGNGFLYCGFYVYYGLTSFSPFLPGRKSWNIKVAVSLIVTSVVSTTYLDASGDVLHHCIPSILDFSVLWVHKVLWFSIVTSVVHASYPAPLWICPKCLLVIRNLFYLTYAGIKDFSSIGR